MTFLNLPHSLLEIVAEDAEDFLSVLNVPLMSHSYENIIQQAVSLGFNSPILKEYFN